MLSILLIACAPDPMDTASTSTATTLGGELAIDADYTVPAGTTLTIAAGAVLTFAADAHLFIDGELIAVGSGTEPILFTGDAEAPWGGIVVHDGAVDAVFDGVDVYESGSVLDGVTIEHATRGLELDAASPYVHAVTFRQNTISPTVDTVGGAALLVRDGATPRIRDCVFEGNVAEVFAFGGALYVDRADPIVQDSVFTGNSGSYGGAISTDLMASPIVGSTFTNNTSASEGGAISLVSTVSALLNDTITGNFAETDGAGLHVCVDCYPHAAPTLYDDAIQDNTSEAAPGDGAAGVGAAFLGGVDGVVIAGNLGAGEPSDFAWFNRAAEAWPAWVASPDLSPIWWGTTDPEAVAQTVHDGADDPTYSVVKLDPIRAAAPGPAIPRVVIASRKMLYEDAGDEVPVFLTVYNPGEQQVLTLTITQGGAPFTGTLDYPGATGSGGSWTLDLPANSVWFGTIAESIYDGATTSDTSWEATLTTGDGTIIGVPSITRYLYEPTP